jgi:hypothetical protein
MWIYTPHILHSSSCNHTAPSIAVSTWKLGHSQIFPICVSVMSTYRYHHFTTYNMGIKDLHKRYYPSFIYTFGPYGDLHKNSYVDHTLRIIPGIRGRLIPHIECQEYKMNITNHIQSSHSRRYKRIFELSVQNILYICSLLQIFCQMHLLIKSVILINPCKSICQKRVEI